MSEAYDNLLSEKNAAQYLSVPQMTLCRWRHRGLGPVFIKFGVPGHPRWRVGYRLSDLNAFVAARAVQTSRMPRPIPGRLPSKGLKRLAERG